jgi:putative salt-induced outer membrane protein
MPTLRSALATALCTATFLTLGLTPGLTLALTPALAQDSPISAPVAAMIRAAATLDDGAALEAVLQTAIRTFPDQREALIALAQSLARSQDAPAEAPADPPAEPTAEPGPGGFFSLSGWQGQIDLGGTLNNGNTREKAVSTALSVKRDANRWKHAAKLTFDFTQSGGVTTKQRLFAAYQLDYKFSDRAYALGLADYEDDSFSGFTNRVNLGAGFGYKVLATEHHHWSLEAGPGLRLDNIAGGGRDTSLVGRMASRFSWDISDTAIFSHDASALIDGGALLEATAALTLKINAALSGKLSYNARYNTRPPAGIRKTDTTTRASIVYSF